MNKTVCPVCGCELSAKFIGISDPFADEVLVICPSCKEKDITPYGGVYRFELDMNITWSEIVQTAKKEYAEKRASLIGKKWVEIEDNTPMGNYYGSGGEWQECSQSDGERRTE